MRFRDLFVRLQSGSALNAQERRDAMPGGMNDFVLRLGGKPDILKYPGHDYFKAAMGAKPGGDRGKTRQLAAQVTSLLLAQSSAVGATLPDINAAAIDELYHDNLDFDPNGAEARRISKVFDLLHRLLRDGMRPRAQRTRCHPCRPTCRSIARPFYSPHGRKNLPPLWITFCST